MHMKMILYKTARLLGVVSLFTICCQVALDAGIGDINSGGWTVLAPSPDSITVYVSSSEGDDSNDGLTPATAKRSIDAASVLIRDGYPDWLLLKRGDTFG